MKLFDDISMITFRNLILISFLLLFNTPLFSQNENTVLWKVTSPDKRITSYLFGVYESFSIKFARKHRPIMNAFKSSTVFCCESPMSNAASTIMTSIPDDSLKWLNYCSREQQHRITSFYYNVFDLTPFKTQTINIACLKVMFNGWISKMTTVRLENSAQPYRISFFLHGKALVKKKKMVYLETPLSYAQTINIVSGNKDQTVAQLQATVNVLDSMIILYNNKKKFNDTYAENYYNLQWNYGFEISEDTLPMGILINRNIGWMPQLIKTCSSEPTFIMVNIFQLMYTGGLIQLLRKQNFTVEPISLTAEK